MATNGIGANPIKGDLPFSADGKTYTLRFNTSAIIRLERATGKGFAKIARELGDPEFQTMDLLCSVVRHGLHKHHPSLTEDETCELIDTVGMMQMFQHIAEAIRLAFPAEPAPPADEGEAGAHPH